MSYRNVKLARHFQTLVGQYPMTDCCSMKRILSVIQSFIQILYLLMLSLFMTNNDIVKFLAFSFVFSIPAGLFILYV